MLENKKTIFIVGASGYVGTMLMEQFSQREDVKEVIGIDKEPIPDLLENNPKVFWVDGNTSDKKWQEIVAKRNPDVVIHTAWQIREMYGNQETQWKWNVEGSNDVFDFSFNTPSVKKLIYFSTVSSYGASSKNTFEDIFTEDSPFIEDEYLYGVEKKVVEQNLKRKYNEARARGNDTQVFIVRPAAISGPRGRFMRIRFGLQSALSGQLKEGFIHKTISFLVSRVPVTPGWVRQFIHEDDVVDIVKMFSFDDLKASYEIFNISPPGEAVYGEDMAKAVNKKPLHIKPWMVRLAFFWFWHLTRGRVPTAKGGWKFYSYPILVDGSKLTKQYGFKYNYDSKTAFTTREGRYSKYIEEGQ
ncbi:NAD-dependent epimerase/dehydratase family protein [Patescibacteria group bacterium]|nr:NAD-dependent epimerase/dehydratase family protein [Patescibacteria group bacterium]